MAWLVAPPLQHKKLSENPSTIRRGINSQTLTGTGGQLSADSLLELGLIRQSVGTTICISLAATRVMFYPGIIQCWTGILPSRVLHIKSWHRRSLRLSNGLWGETELIFKGKYSEDPITGHPVTGNDLGFKNNYVCNHMANMYRHSLVKTNNVVSSLWLMKSSKLACLKGRRVSFSGAHWCNKPSEPSHLFTHCTCANLSFNYFAIRQSS